MSRKAEKREHSREAKAEKAALIDKHIENELLHLLKTDQRYGDIYNVDPNFNKAVGKLEIHEQIREEEVKICLTYLGAGV